MKTIFVKDFMTTNVVSVKPNTSVKDVAKTIFVNGFNGVPVVDDNNILVGLITEYDFLSKGSPLYFSPIAQLLKELKPYREDEKEIEKKIAELLSSEAYYVMNSQPVTLFPDNNITEAANLFLRHHRINPIPVIDDKGKLVGIISRHDLIKLYIDPIFWKRLLEKDNNA